MKLKDKIDNNEDIIFIKKIWADKRYRSLLLLAIYFVFFFVVIAGLRNNYNDTTYEEPKEVEPVISIVDKMKTSFENMKDYNYKILLNDEDIINGSINGGINTFEFNKKSYTVVSDIVYLKNNDNLIKTDLTKNNVLLVSPELLTINKIYSYLNNLEPIGKIESDDYQITYNVSLSTLFTDEVGDFKLIIGGNENIKTVSLDLTEYAKQKKLKLDSYKLDIVVGDE